MIDSMAYRLVAALVVVSAWLGISSTGAYAQVALTGGAKANSSTSETLYGYADPSNPDSEWFFQYGTSTLSLKSTAPHAIGAGPSSQVSASVSSLTQGKTYVYRFVVQQGSYPATYDYGDYKRFTTASNSAPVATTGPATSASTGSALLHGIANTSDPDSEWAFQYATSPSYAKYRISRPMVIGAGVRAVQAAVGPLSPNTTYYYRLVVRQGSYPASYYVGATRAFRTRKPVRYGRATLIRTRLAVHGGKVSIPIRCTGVRGARCAGKLRLLARGAHGASVACGKASFTLTAGSSTVLKSGVGSGCEALLRNSRAHTLAATLHASFTSHQGRLNARVKLIGT